MKNRTMMLSAALFTFSGCIGAAFADAAPRANLICKACHSTIPGLCAERKCPPGAIGCWKFEGVTAGGVPFINPVCVFPDDDEPIEA